MDGTDNGTEGKRINENTGTGDTELAAVADTVIGSCFADQFFGGNGGTEEPKAKNAAEYGRVLFNERAKGSVGKNVSTETRKTSVHSGHRKRLRQAAYDDPELYGLSDVEIIELLLSYFVPQKDTNVTAHRLLDKYGSVYGVLRAPSAELSRVSGVTLQAASLMPLLAFFCVAGGCVDVKINSRREAAEMFGALFGNGSFGTYVAFLDGKFGIAAVEKFTDGLPALRAIVAAACGYDARYVFVARRDGAFLPSTFDIVSAVRELTQTLASVGVRLLDYMMFTDYGYYTLGSPPRSDGSVIYTFTPVPVYADASDMISRLGKMRYTEDKRDGDSENIRDTVKQLGMILDCGTEHGPK